MLNFINITFVTPFWTSLYKQKKIIEVHSFPIQRNNNYKDSLIKNN